MEGVNTRICSNEEPWLPLSADIYCHLRSGNMTISGSKRYAPSVYRLILSPFVRYPFFFSLFLMLSLVITGSWRACPMHTIVLHRLFIVNIIYQCY